MPDDVAPLLLAAVAFGIVALLILPMLPASVSRPRDDTPPPPLDAYERHRSEVH